MPTIKAKGIYLGALDLRACSACLMPLLDGTPTGWRSQLPIAQAQ